MQEGLTNGLGGEVDIRRWNRLARFESMLEEVVSSNAFWQRRLGNAPARGSSEAFRRLPLTSNQDFSRDLQEEPPFGTNLTYPLAAYSRYHQTSGTIGRPLPVLDTPESWTWWCDCWDAVLDACGVRSDDRAFFAFSYAPFIGFWSAHDAVVRRDLFTVTGGGASTARRLRLLQDTDCTLLFSTPSYALRMAETAGHEGIDIAGSSIRSVILAGEPGGSLPAVRERISEVWKADVFDHAGSSEVGAFGIPCPQGRGVFVNEREFITEVLALGDDRPVSEGQTGELVITNLGRPGSPVIRYRTGDLVRPKRLPEGLLLEGGILGRADHMMLIRGVNLHPSAIEEAVRRETGATEFRITVTRENAMDEADVEVEGTPSACRAIAEDVRNSFGVRIRVRSVPPESLPRWQAKAKRFRDFRD